MKKNTIGLFAISLLFLAGCSTYKDELKVAKQHWSVGNVAQAEKAVVELHSDKEDSADILIFDLELATISRANCNFERSIKLFNDANARIEIFEEKAGTKVSEEAKAMLTNLSYIPYKGYNYDKIMLSVYQSLNYMETKEFDLARVQFKKLANFQENAERINEKRIEADKKVIEESKKGKGFDSSALLRAGGVSSKLEAKYGNSYKQGLSEQQSKALYVNPFAYWLSGLYYANVPADSSDKALAADYFRLGGEMFGNRSKLFAEDFQMASDLRDGKIASPSNLTYVIYETGSAPERDQFKIEIPLMAINPELPYVAVSFPFLVNNNSYNPNLDIVANGNNIEMETIVNFDAIIKREFDSELPMIVTKTLVASAAKAIAQYAVKKAAGGGWGGLAAQVGGAVYQSSMNDSDLRTWMTLPKEIKVARFETPEEGFILVDGAKIVLNKDSVNVVIAKRVSANTALLLRTFDFTKEVPEYAKLKNQ